MSEQARGARTDSRKPQKMKLAASQNEGLAARNLQRTGAGGMLTRMDFAVRDVLELIPGLDGSSKKFGRPGLRGATSHGDRMQHHEGSSGGAVATDQQGERR